VTPSDLHQRRSHSLKILVWGIIAAGLWATRAWANPCNSSVPDCQAQVQAGISYSGWETKQWAYYCSGDHVYYCSSAVVICAGDSSGFVFDNKCFSVAENILAEGRNPSKMSATITNWCFKKETLVITLPCSDKLRAE
jgi:hypothetical protein